MRRIEEEEFLEILIPLRFFKYASYYFQIVSLVFSLGFLFLFFHQEHN